MQHTDYYIYCYYDTRTDPHTPIYVGRGRKDRYLQHYKKTHNKYLSNKLDKIKEETGKHALVLKLEENLNNEQANEREIYYISKYGRIDLDTGTLCNLTNGGEATDGWKPHEETKKIWSQQRKGKKQTEAQYKANCSRMLTEEQKQRLNTIGNKFKKGCKKSEEEINKVIQSKINKRPNLINLTFGFLTITEDISTTTRQKVKCSCICGNTEYRILVCELKRKKNLNCNQCNSFKLDLKKDPLFSYLNPSDYL